MPHIPINPESFENLTLSIIPDFTIKSYPKDGTTLYLWAEYLGSPLLGMNQHCYVHAMGVLVKISDYFLVKNLITEILSPIACKDLGKFNLEAEGSSKFRIMHAIQRAVGVLSCRPLI